MFFNRMFLVFFVFTWINLAIFFPQAIFAQSVTDDGVEAAIEAVILASPAEVTVGDVFTLTLEVTHPADSRATLGQIADPWGPFEIREIERIETSTIEDNGVDSAQSISTQKIRATLWQTGTYTTPDLQVAIVDATGDPAQYDVDPATITVLSVLQTSDADLRDIKPQASLPYIPLWQQVLTGALVTLVLLGLLAWWLWRRRAQRPEVVEEEVPVVVDDRPADVKALEALLVIIKEDLPRQRRFGEHYVRITDVVRGYLEDGFKISALDRTTAEVKNNFPPNAIGANERRELFQLLDEADLVKFAQVEPDIINAEEVPDRARQFIVTTAARLGRSQPNNSQTSSGAAEPTPTEEQGSAASQNAAPVFPKDEVEEMGKEG